MGALSPLACMHGSIVLPRGLHAWEHCAPHGPACMDAPLACMHVGPARDAPLAHASFPSCASPAMSPPMPPCASQCLLQSPKTPMPRCAQATDLCEKELPSLLCELCGWWGPILVLHIHPGGLCLCQHGRLLGHHITSRQQAITPHHITSHHISIVVCWARKEGQVEVRARVEAALSFG